MQDTLPTAHRPDADSVLQDIADYVLDYEIRSPRAYAMAGECLVDALAGCFLALQDPDCGRYLGPVVPGATLAHGARVPGTSLELDPVMAAFNIGALLGSRSREHPRVAHPDGDLAAAGGGHPADTLGAILAVADYRSRQAHNDGAAPLRVRDVLTAMIKAHEIQRVIAESNGFGRGALDPVILVRVAVAAVATQMQAGNRAQVLAAVSHAWLDGGSLRRTAQPDGRDGRRVWAAADAGGRGVRLSLLALAGEPGYAGTLSAPRWGFYDALFEGHAFRFDRAYGSHCMDHPTFATRGPDAFAAAVTGHFPAKQADRILARFADPATLAVLPVNEMLATLVKNS
jgi:2-methylcitrate dehydratase